MVPPSAADSLQGCRLLMLTLPSSERPLISISTPSSSVAKATPAPSTSALMPERLPLTIASAPSKVTWMVRLTANDVSTVATASAAGA